jgi:hypothetical protein
MTDRTNYRWSKFVWKDWSSDPALRSCSLGARGLWMDLLCLCHDGEPRGYLTIGGRAPSVGEIAKLVGAHHHQVVKLLDELEGRGVFSRTGDGVIYSRRQVRDQAQMVASVEWGHHGGNPKLNRGGSKANGSGRVNPPVKATPKPDSDSGIENLESPSPTPHPASGGGAKADLINAVKDAAHAAASVPLEAVRRRPFRLIAGAAA